MPTSPSASGNLYCITRLGDNNCVTPNQETMIRKTGPTPTFAKLDSDAITHREAHGSITHMQIPATPSDPATNYDVLGKGRLD